MLVYSLPNGGSSATVWGVRVSLVLILPFSPFLRAPPSGPPRLFSSCSLQWLWQSSVHLHQLRVCDVSRVASTLFKAFRRPVLLDVQIFVTPSSQFVVLARWVHQYHQLHHWHSWCGLVMCCLDHGCGDHQFGWGVHSDGPSDIVRGSLL